MEINGQLNERPIYYVPDAADAHVPASYPSSLDTPRIMSYTHRHNITIISCERLIKRGSVSLSSEYATTFPILIRIFYAPLRNRQVKKKKKKRLDVQYFDDNDHCDDDDGDDDGDDESSILIIINTRAEMTKKFTAVCLSILIIINSEFLNFLNFFLNREKSKLIIKKKKSPYR